MENDLKDYISYLYSEIKNKNPSLINNKVNSIFNSYCRSFQNLNFINQELSKTLEELSSFQKEDWSYMVKPLKEHTSQDSINHINTIKKINKINKKAFFLIDSIFIHSKIVLERMRVFIDFVFNKKRIPSFLNKIIWKIKFCLEREPPSFYEFLENTKKNYPEYVHFLRKKKEVPKIINDWRNIIEHDDYYINKMIYSFSQGHNFKFEEKIIPNHNQIISLILEITEYTFNYFKDKL